MALAFVSLQLGGRVEAQRAAVVGAGVCARVGRCAHGLLQVRRVGGVLAAAGFHRGQRRGEVLADVGKIARLTPSVRDKRILLGDLSHAAWHRRRDKVECALVLRSLRGCRVR